MNIFSFNYYGIDYLAAVCAIIGMFFLGNKKRIGFVFYMLATTAGVGFSILAKSLPFVIMNIITFSLNLRGFILWKNK
jgi:hypothetical protein